jgi:hypothetical protein
VPNDGNGCQDTLRGAGGCLFGPLAKAAWEGTVLTDRKNRMTLGLNCLLLQASGKWSQLFNKRRGAG